MLLLGLDAKLGRPIMQLEYKQFFFTKTTILVVIHSTYDSTLVSHRLLLLS